MHSSFLVFIFDFYQKPENVKLRLNFMTFCPSHAFIHHWCWTPLFWGSEAQLGDNKRCHGTQEFQCFKVISISF